MSADVCVFDVKQCRLRGPAPTLDGNTKVRVFNGLTTAAQGNADKL